MSLKRTTIGLVLALSVGILNLLAADSEPSSTPKPAPKPADLFPDIVVAKGKDVEVKRSRLDEELVTIKGSAAANGRTIPLEQVTMLEQQILERLIQIQLLTAKATDADRAKAKTNSAKRFETIQTRAGSEEALNRQLKSVGITIAILRAKMLEEAVAEAVLERELKINITDEEVKKFYDENPSKFEQAEMVRASHILLSTKDETGTELSAERKEAKRKQMEDLLKRARAGEDFAKLAKENSEDPGSRESGGEYTFPRGRMVAEFEAVAFSLQTNQISDIVTTQFGYHIIKLSEKIPAKKTEQEKVSSDIRDYLKQQSAQKALPDYMAKLKKDAGVEILDAKLKPTKTDLDFPAPPPAPATEKKK